MQDGGAEIGDLLALVRTAVDRAVAELVTAQTPEQAAAVAQALLAVLTRDVRVELTNLAVQYGGRWEEAVVAVEAAVDHITAGRTGAALGELVLAHGELAALTFPESPGPDPIGAAPVP